MPPRRKIASPAGSGDAREKGQVFFSRWSTLSEDDERLPSPATPEMVYVPIVKTEDCPHRTGVWAVAIWAQEVAVVQEGLGRPASDSTLAKAQRSSRLKARIEAHGSSGGDVWDVDIGQGIRLSLEADYVRVGALIPQTNVIGPRSTSRLRDGLLLTTMVGARIAPVTGSHGAQLATNSFTYVIPADTEWEAPLPPGCRALSAYQDGGNAFLLEWRLYPGGASLGELVFPVEQRLSRLARPGLASHIALAETDEENERVLTLVWELEI
jgi:hypothetical protein